MRPGPLLIAAGALLAGCGEDEDACARGVPGTVCRVAGTGELAFNGDGRPAGATALYLPSQVRRGPDGLVHVMDFNNLRLRRIEADGTMTTLAGDGFHAGATEGAHALDSPLENPIDFDFLPDGRIVFVSYHDPRVFVIDVDGRLLRIAGTSVQGVIGNEGDGGPARAARFIEVTGIAVAPGGAIYVADGGASRIRVITPGAAGLADATIATFAGTGVPGVGGDGGPARDAELDVPTALALDAAGALYVADAGSSRIRRIAPDGTIATVGGSGRAADGDDLGDGGPARDAALANPEGIAVAPDGALYVGDRFHNRIRRIAPDGTITTIAGTGAEGLTGDGGPALAAAFGYVARVQLDTDGGLLIADQTSSAIRKVLPPLD